jgi:integrase
VGIRVEIPVPDAPVAEQGAEGPLKTFSSYRDIDILDPLYEVLRHHRATSPKEAIHVFTNKRGRPLEVNNLRNRVWYRALTKAGLRRRTMYQTRHTFASLMLSHGEDPLWVARTLGHTGPDMIYKHYGKFIRNRVRKDGTRFLEGFTGAKVVPVLGVGPLAVEPPDPLPATPCGGQEVVCLLAG